MNKPDTPPRGARALVEALLDEPGLQMSPRLADALERAQEELHGEADEPDCGSCSCVVYCEGRL